MTVGDVGGLVEQSRTRRRLIGDTSCKLETNGGEYQPEEQLEEAGVYQQEELAEDNLSEEIAEQQLSEETAELESAAEWQVKCHRRRKQHGRSS
jgi:hypothetical protein